MASANSNTPDKVQTKILIISDTHGLTFPTALHPNEAVDVAIHCGDLTHHSTLAEFNNTLSLMESLNADLKLFIAGNHDFSLDPAAFQDKIAETKLLSRGVILDTLFGRDFGAWGEALNLLRHTTAPNLFFLEEGNYKFRLKNGALLKVYATPYTPSNNAGWGFQYRGDHDFSINGRPDVVISHGPPRGILDRDRDTPKRLGCPLLFKAVANAQPKIHCFGHVHSSWGAKFITWKSTISDSPSHFTDIEQSKSHTLATLAMEQNGVHVSSHCAEDEYPVGNGSTLFVNAANADDERLSQMAQIVDIELDRVRQDGH